MGTPVRVFLNSKSGNGCDADSIAEHFARHGSACVITPVKKSISARRLAQSDNPEMVFVAAGGDGTVNLVASAVAGTSRRMGVLPVGTLNHFAKDLGLPLTLEPAVAAIATGTVRAVDVAEVNGQVFVNNSSLGTYPEMVVDRERMKKSGRNKWASLVAASVRAFVRFRCMTVEFEVDGTTRRCITPFLFVGNNEYCVDGTGLGTRKRLDEGRLSLYLAPGATRSTMLRFVVAALFGRLKQMEQFEEFRPERSRVTTRRRRLRVSLDGEVRHLRTPLEYRIRPSALCVLVPEEAV